MKKKILFIVIFVIAALFLILLYDNIRIVNTEYVYTSNKIPKAFDGYRICLVTDFHNSDNYKAVAKKVKEAKPDIICVGGDLVSMNTKDFSNAVSLMKELVGIAKVYYTYGNHEVWSNDVNKTEEPRIKEELKGLDITFLNNKVRTIYKGDECINLIGYADNIYYDFSDHFVNEAKDEVRHMYDTLDKDVLSVLVFHRAQYFDMLSDIGYDVVLSGHLHGGHINLPYVKDYILKKHFNSDKYSKGMYKNGDSTMYVCTGTERKKGLLRVFNTPEIVSLELRSE